MVWKYSKNFCNMQNLLHGLVFLIRLKRTIACVFQSSEIATASWVLTLMWGTYVICKMFLIRLPWTEHIFLFFCLHFLFWTHVLCLTHTIEICQSLNIGCVWWLSDCFGRLSSSLCCLFTLCPLKCVICCLLAAQTWLDWHFC